MKIFLDDIKKKQWLTDSLIKYDWGKQLLTLKAGTFLVIYYDMNEALGTIKIYDSKVVYELNDAIYKNYKGNNIAFIQEPFDSANYFLYSLFLTAVEDFQEKTKFLEDMYVDYKEKDIEQAKENLKTNIKGSFEINSRLDLQSTLDYYYKYDKRAYNGMCMVYDLIEQYTQHKYNKSFYGGFLTHILRLVKNPNGGIMPEMPQSTLRYLIIGEVAAGNDESLKLAKELYRAGNSIKNIYLKTNWFLNTYDNKWRKRISDDTFKIDQNKLTNQDGSIYFIPKDLSIENYLEFLKQFIKNNNSNFFEKSVLNGTYNVRIGDYISFDEAFKYYPELKNLYSIFALHITEQFYSFYFNPSTPERLILIDGQLNETIDSIKYTTLHEMQHYIQKVEGFANGGNPQLADIISLVGGASFRDYFISYEAFRKRFMDVCPTIPKLAYAELGLKLGMRFNAKTQEIKSKNLKMRYDDNLGRHLFIDVIDYAGAIIEQFKQVLDNFQPSSADSFSAILLKIYAILPELDDIIEPFVTEYVGNEYLELFKQSLKQAAKTLDRDTNYRLQGWTATDLYILNFATYQSLFGEIEARFTQQTSTLPTSLKNYFDLYTSETIDIGKIVVYNESMLYTDPSKQIVAALETYDENKYIIHTVDKSVTINLLHETGHILFDFAQPNPDLNFEKEEYFCDCFVDYIHRKNIDPQLTEVLGRDRKIKDIKDYDHIFEEMLFGEKMVIDEEGLIKRLEFINLI